MNRIVTFCIYCFALLYATAVFAQKPIIFDKTSHMVKATSGGAYSMPLNNFDLPVGDGLEWNFADGFEIPTFAGYSILSFKDNQNTKYPNTLQSDSTFVNITPTLGFYTNSYFRQSTTQFEEFAIDNPALQTYSLTAMSGGANDVLDIPAQTIVFSTPRIAIPYPATFKSAWKNNYRTVANTQLTVAAFGLNKTPLSLVKNMTIQDTVVGWGIASVPMMSGKKSKSYDVLIVKRASTRQDSFYLGGQPAPVPLMNAFGVSQGSTETIYRYIVYRLGVPNYLFALNYGTDASMTLTPRIAISDIVEEAVPTSAEEMHTYVSSSVAPNPATNEITLSLQKSNDAPWTVDIYSTLGVLVDSRMISAGYGDVDVPLSVTQLSSGTYNYILRDENNHVVASKSFVVTH